MPVRRWMLEPFGPPQKMNESVGPAGTFSRPPIRICVLSRLL
jgi:hypothetical protein